MTFANYLEIKSIKTMKKLFFSAVIATALFACNSNGTSDADSAKDSTVNAIENKTDSLQDQVQQQADSTKNALEQTSDSLKEVEKDTAAKK